jgi:hypothetical protein
MELSIYLAKLLGIYFLIVAFEMMLRREEFEKTTRNFASSTGLLFFSGSVSLILGLAIVIGHPVYEMGFQGLITILGYVMILRGVWRMTFPSHVQKKLVTCFHKGYRGILFVLLVLGAYLTYSGFTQ